MKKINVKEISDAMRENVKQKVSTMGTKPTLCVITVGNDDASLVYVRNKRKACEAAGINFEYIKFDNGDDIRTYDLISTIDKLNKDDNITGILVQLPLPKHIDEESVIHAINPSKDVDGFTISQTGQLCTNSDLKNTLVPCTAIGILDILANVTNIDGKNVVVVGRSNIVGKPVGQVLLNKNATVTICHSHTKDLARYTSSADIVILATGNGKSFNRDFFSKTQEDLIIIDAGISYCDGKLSGDLDVESLEDYLPDSVQYTSVPGGVGLMTVAELLQNVLKSYKLLQLSKEADMYISLAKEICAES